jgi:hypothetical protein
MTIDKTVYDYTPYRAPNIVHETAILNAVKLPAGITPYEIIAPLLDRLAKYHPEWTFVSSLVVIQNDGSHRVSSYRVYENKEYLGYFATASRNYSKVILLDGPRISKVVDRGKGKRTGDIKKAVKIAEEYFRPTTSDEHLKSLRILTSSIINEKQAAARGRFQTEFHPLSDAVTTYVLENWDTTKAALRDKGLYVDDAVNFQELYEKTQAMDRLAAAKNQAHGVNVWVSNGDYHVINFSAKNRTVYQSDTLPVGMKGKLGMLKMLNVGDVLPDVGARITETGFFVVGEGE